MQSRVGAANCRQNEVGLGCNDLSENSLMPWSVLRSCLLWLWGCGLEYASAFRDGHRWMQQGAMLYCNELVRVSLLPAHHLALKAILLNIVLLAPR